MTRREEQVVLITGCSTGIGRALARELRTRGHRPFATARRPESIADLAAEGLDTLQLDVKDTGSIDAAVRAVIDRAGTIDVLINNAGVNIFGPLAETPLDSLREVFDTNVLGLAAVTQAVFPYLAERRSGLHREHRQPCRRPTHAVRRRLLRDQERRPHALRSAAHGSVAVRHRRGGRSAGRRKSSIADSGARDLERYQSKRSRYQPVYAGIEKRTYASQENPMLAEDFARELVAQAFATPPPRLIRLGTGTDVLPRLAELPGEQRDAMLSAHYGLDALAK